MLVNLQSPDSSWPADLDEEEVEDPLVSTSFNLMFPPLFLRTRIICRKVGRLGVWISAGNLENVFFSASRL